MFVHQTCTRASHDPFGSTCDLIECVHRSAFAPIIGLFARIPPSYPPLLCPSNTHEGRQYNPAELVPASVMCWVSRPCVNPAISCELLPSIAS